jgi:hypothetical protein
MAHLHQTYPRTILNLSVSAISIAGLGVASSQGGGDTTVKKNDETTTSAKSNLIDPLSDLTLRINHEFGWEIFLGETDGCAYNLMLNESDCQRLSEPR